MSKAKGKQAEKDKGSPAPTPSITTASTPSIALADISLLLDGHRAALTADFKSSFESLTSTLDSIHSTITDCDSGISAEYRSPMAELNKPGYKPALLFPAKLRITLPNGDRAWLMSAPEAVKFVQDLNIAP
ncbi:hypothetical protein KUCAC02_009935 [Chaenocephalus aceratus]|uniref:Uncharacterized protein n=1 Tax=Chaenocephalus aceratus TaxID=36190 RepID=A0ACB9VYE9_CHAAC|nr:hypothetical protein KUCAC02_009935 [Chaenocephalus aceratus]